MMRLYEIRKRPVKRYVYHMTNSRNLPSIKKYGLRTPNTGGHETNWGGNLGAYSDDKIFFGTEEIARYYGNIIRQAIDRDSIYHTYFAMLRVPVDKLPDIRNDTDGTRVMPHDFYVQKTVPPRFIEMKWGDRDEYEPLLSANVEGIALGEWDDVKDDFELEDDDDETE